MQIAYDKPAEKGVTRLMYVGDDLQPTSRVTWPFLIVLGVVAYLAMVYPGRASQRR